MLLYLPLIVLILALSGSGLLSLAQAATGLLRHPSKWLGGTLGRGALVFRGVLFLGLAVVLASTVMNQPYKQYLGILSATMLVGLGGFCAYDAVKGTGDDGNPHTAKERKKMFGVAGLLLATGAWVWVATTSLLSGWDRIAITASLLPSFSAFYLYKAWRVDKNEDGASQKRAGLVAIAVITLVLYSIFMWQLPQLPREATCGC